jgi:hypothetical protein
MEVLTRGPVHEAFAELTASDGDAGLVVQKAPPAAIEEIPPEERPEGDNYAWIPGYWGWDEQRNDFLWISGIWRIPPPDCNWTPGYWAQTDGGFQWVAGFWLANEVEGVNYLPAPPESLEAGPQGDPISQDQVWIPGSWVWPVDHYVWQPGYWLDARPDWVYTPTHYNRTPRGYVYVNGYWDYPIANRGVLFAPVYFNQPVYAQPAFSYSPSVLIEVGGLTNNLFRYPRYNHYVFGDYYGDESIHLGIVPWFQLDIGHHDYDPIYSHQRWDRGRHDSHWSDQMQSDYRHRRETVDARPPRVFVDAQTSAQALPEGKPNNFVNAKTLQEVASEKNSSIKLIKMDQGERDNLGKTGKDLRKFTEERVQRETVQASQTGAAPSQGPAAKMEKLAIPKSPIKSVATSVKNDSKAPPVLPTMPKLDANAQAGTLKDKGGEAGKTLEKGKEPSKIEPEAKPFQGQPALTQDERKKGTSSPEPAKRVLESKPPTTAPKVSEPLPAAKHDGTIKEQDKPKAEPVEKPETKGKVQNQDTPKDKGVQHIQLPSQPNPNQAVPNSTQGAPKNDGAGVEPKDQNLKGNLKQRNIQRNAPAPPLQKQSDPGSTSVNPPERSQQKTFQRVQDPTNAPSLKTKGPGINQQPQGQLPKAKIQNNARQPQTHIQNNQQAPQDQTKLNRVQPKTATTSQPIQKHEQISPIADRGRTNPSLVKPSHEAPKAVPRMNRGVQLQPPPNTGVNPNQGAPKMAPRTNRDSQLQPPPNTGVSQNQGVPKIMPKVNRKQQLQTPPAPQQVQNQDPNGNGKDKN